MRKTARRKRERRANLKRNEKREKRGSSPNLSLSLSILSRLLREGRSCASISSAGRDSPRRTVAFSEEMDRWSAGCPIPPRAKSGYSRRFASRMLERKASRPLCPSSPFVAQEGKCTEGNLADHAAVHSPTVHEVGFQKERIREREIFKIKSIWCVKL